MVKRRLWLPLLGLLWIAQSALAASFTASVDRNQISENDSFILSLRYDEQVLMGSPELSALQHDFQLLGQNRSQQYRSVNGQTTSFTQWDIRLSPKRLGSLTIPAIEFKGQHSNAIAIEVTPISQSVREQTDKDFFFEVEIEPKDALVVQQQVLYTEKLYYGQNHQNANLSPLEVSDARVVPLGEVKNYTTVINGRQLGVYERRYAIFPDVAGNLVIPGQRFSAQASNPYDRWSRGQEVSVVSKRISLPVAGIPANYPKGEPWLPSSNLNLSEQFSDDDGHWQAGEAVTRRIRIEAQGIAGNQLPELSFPPLSGLRYYPDKAKARDHSNAQGVLGSLEYEVALVASENGKLTLPAIRIAWWNTRTQQVAYATLPAHEIQVQGGLAASANALPASPLTDNARVVTSEQADAAVNEWASVPVRWWVMALLILSLMTNLYFLIRYLPSRRRQNSLATQATTASLSAAWRTLSQDCLTDDPVAIRRSLLAWLNAGGIAWLTQPIHNLTEFSQQCSDADLKTALAELDAKLYGHSRTEFDGKALKRLLEKMQKEAPLATQAGLYPR